MSETFEKILVKDDRIGAITDKVKFSVFKGGQNVTAQPYKAISESTPAQVFNVAVPSLETIISREVLWKSRVTLKISGEQKVKSSGATSAGKPANQFLVNYGVTDALAAFPLHSLISTMTATINNNTVSMNMSDVLPAMLRMCDPEDLSYYNDMTPTTLDYLGDYRDGVDLMEYQIAMTTTDPRLVALTPDPAFAIPGAGTGATGTSPQTFISYPNNVLAFDQNRLGGSAKMHKSNAIPLLCILI